MSKTEHTINNNKETYNPIDVACGAIIKKLRLGQNMSQSHLADSIGLTFQQIQKYERGANRVSVSRLYQIADVLGVAVADLLPPTDKRLKPKAVIILTERVEELEGVLAGMKSTAAEALRHV